MHLKRRFIVLVGLIGVIYLVISYRKYLDALRYHIKRTAPSKMILVDDKVTVGTVISTSQKNVLRLRVSNTTYTHKHYRPLSLKHPTYHLMNKTKPRKRTFAPLFQSWLDTYKHKLSRVRPERCTSCFMYRHEYQIIEKDICKLEGDKYVKLLVLVFTKHENYIRRDVIRNTWLSIYRNQTSHIRYIFLLGTSTQYVWNKIVIKEAKKFNDIIMGDFRDNYMHLTYKTLMGMQYVSTYCYNAQYVFKTDDDMWVNMEALQNVIEKYGSKLKYAIGGACGNISEPIRDVRSKYYASFTSYPYEYYPRFCSGTSYVMGTNVAIKIATVSEDVPFFHLEDIYVAFCIERLGYGVLALPNFKKTSHDFILCDFKSNLTVTVHEVSDFNLRRIWSTRC